MNPRRITRLPAPLRRVAAPAVLCLAGLALAAATSVASPIGWNAFGGWYTQDNNFLLGGGARVAFGTITANPNFEYIFINNGTSYTINLDATMSVLPLAVGSGWVGAGLAFYTVDPDKGDSSTDTGANVLAGFGLNAIPLKPYGQIKWLFVNGNNPFAFQFGVRF